MISATWDRRIVRAEELARAHPAAAEALGFYAQVARFQKGVYDALSARSKPDTTLLIPYFAPLLSLVKRIGPEPLAQAAGELAATKCELQELLIEPDTGDEVRGFFARALLQPYKIGRASCRERV